MEIRRKKILLLSTGDVNGAYEAIYKLAHLFIAEGHTVCMLVKKRTKSEKFIVEYLKAKKRHSIIATVLIKIKNKLKQKLGQKPQSVHFDVKYSFISKDETKENIIAENVISQIGFVPDFIITGMTDGFINSTDLLNLYNLTKAKVYNITVDMNHFTGGCHYAWNCVGYIKGCDEK